jgi:hypothetical protein
VAGNKLINLSAVVEKKEDMPMERVTEKEAKRLARPILGSFTISQPTQFFRPVSIVDPVFPSE